MNVSNLVRALACSLLLTPCLADNLTDFLDSLDQSNGDIALGLLNMKPAKFDFGSYSPKKWSPTTMTQGLYAHISLQQTALGVNFLRVDLDLYSNSTAHFN